MYEEIYQKFQKCALEKCNLNSYKGKIIAAVSGGADSVGMLLLLKELFGKDRIICAHFNHKIRIGDSDEDASFVEHLSASLGIEFLYEEANVPFFSEKNHLGLEEAARILRYGFLRRIAGDNYIAVAHNKGDKIETIFHNISRGTSIDGLKGIEYEKNNIVRPILDLSKDEINQVCEHFNIKPVFDKTNSDNSYTRNKIRNKILPFLKNELNDSFEDHILQLSNAATVDSSFLEKYTKKVFDEVCVVTNQPFFKIELNYSKYSDLDVAIKRRLIRLILSQIINSDKKAVFPEYTGIYSDMILRVENALEIKETGKITEVSAGVICVTDYNGSYFTHKDIINSFDKLKDKILVRELSTEEVRNLDFYNKPLNVEYFDVAKMESLYGAAFLDKIKITEWSSDDVIFPIGMEKSKKIRDILINSKIGRFERQFVKLVTIDKDVLWIPKIKRSNIAPIDKNSTRVIIIEYVSE